MVESIGGAANALVGLQTLDINNPATRQTVGLSTSLRAPGPEATSSVVSTLQSSVAQLTATKLGLARGDTIVTVALNAGERVQDKLLELRDLAVQARDENLSDEDRDEIVSEFQTLRDELDSTVLNAEFDDVNLINSSSRSFTIVTDETGRTLNVASQDLSASGLGISDISVSSSAAAAEAVSALDTAIEVAAARVGELRKANGKVREEGDQQDKLIRIADPNVTSQINTDLTEQETTFLAGEVRNTLGVNRLSVANVKSQSLLALIQA